MNVYRSKLDIPVILHKKSGEKMIHPDRNIV